MSDLAADATPAVAAQWMVDNVPFTIAAELLVGGMFSDDTSGTQMIGSAMALWLAYNSEQVRQFEDWCIARRMTVWTG
ncbi:hypothetical protein GCM10007304_17800 [Rhodococcoides trifolii]|uniref:Uncharacterized protein n=1 Tax=Rhodococcoides trifolii TaxID=908250 RepID=A0A917FVC5_9NOCA|nr:hypothetical protein [Rhodococcus trifolii]GGG04095.1 hypothetical protein GCM10007304_17800 [Rhodococcus trifolii]